MAFHIEYAHSKWVLLIAIGSDFVSPYIFNCLSIAINECQKPNNLYSYFNSISEIIFPVAPSKITSFRTLTLTAPELV